MTIAGNNLTPFSKLEAETGYWVVALWSSGVLNLQVVYLSECETTGRWECERIGSIEKVDPNAFMFSHKVDMHAWTRSGTEFRRIG